MKNKQHIQKYILGKINGIILVENWKKYRSEMEKKTKLIKMNIKKYPLHTHTHTLSFSNINLLKINE